MKNLGRKLKIVLPSGSYRCDIGGDKGLYIVKNSLNKDIWLYIPDADFVRRTKNGIVVKEFAKVIERNNLVNLRIKRKQSPQLAKS